jgi:hypothetical protein
LALLALLLLERFPEGFVGTVGSWLATGNAADQIGQLVIKAIREDGIRTLGSGITNDARFRYACQARGLAEACFGSGVEADTFHTR